MSNENTTVEAVGTVLANETKPLTDAQKAALQANVSKGKDFGNLAQLGVPAVLTDEQKAECAASAVKCDTQIEAVRKLYEGSDLLVAEAATMCVIHCYKFGDTSKIAKLFTVLPKTFDVAGFRVLLEKSSPILIPSMHFDHEKKGWYPDFDRTGAARAIRFYPKDSPKIDRLKKAHNGEIWDVKQIERDIDTSEAFVRPKVERIMKATSALIIWEQVMKLARDRLDKAYAPGAARDIDLTFGTQAEADAEYKELETLLKRFIANAKQRHAAASLSNSRPSDTDASGVRRVLPAQGEGNSPPAGSQQPEPQTAVG